jgi:hypothetical protein
LKKLDVSEPQLTVAGNGMPDRITEEELREMERISTLNMIENLDKVLF